MALAWRKSLILLNKRRSPNFRSYTTFDYISWEAKSKEERIKYGPKPKPPVRRIYKLNSLTTEAVTLKQSLQQEYAFIIVVDEIAGFFKSFNQYKKGGGDDLEAWLSFYDGGGIELARVSRNDISLDAVGFSVFGGIQFCKLRKAMGDMKAQDGFWPRFTYIRIPSKRTPDPEDIDDVDLGVIETLYKNLDALPKTEYFLSPDAKALWKIWHRWIEDHRLSEGHEALRVLYPKVKGRAARTALALHAIYQAQGEAMTNEVSKQTLEAAINLVKWELRQTLSIYDELGLSDNPKVDRITRFVAKFRDAEWIDTRTVRGWWSAANKPKAAELRKFMSQVVEMGFAESNGEPVESPGYAIRMISNFSPLVPMALEALQGNDIDGGLSSSPPLVPLVHEVAAQGDALEKGTKETRHGLIASPQLKSNEDKDHSRLRTNGLEDRKKYISEQRSDNKKDPVFEDDSWDRVDLSALDRSGQ